MAPLRPSGSRAAAPTAVVKGRAALTRSTKEGRLQTRPLPRVHRAIRHGTSVPKLRTSPGPPLVTQPGVQNPFSRARHTSSANVVLCELRCCHGSAPRSATGRTRHGIIITSHPTTRPSARLPIAHARYASPPPRLMDAAAAPTVPPSSLARVLSRPLLTSSVAATRARKQS